MSSILKGYVFRMYPNIEQQTLIEKSFGISRYIYNHFLEKNLNEQCRNVYSNIKELPQLTKENSWLKEVDSCLLRNSLFDLENAYQKHNKEKKGYPQFKSKNKSRNSYRTNNITSIYKGTKYESIKLDLEARTIKLPKLKEIKIRGYRNLKEIKGRIINATIYKEANKYYVSICVEEEVIKPILTPTNIVGIDVGIKDLVITSEGKIYKNPKQIKKYENKIKGLNRWLARAKVGSKNRYKIKKKLSRVYQKLKNARKYYLHRISKELVEEHDMIVTEHLKISNMTKNKNLSKEIYDASWNELIRQIEYKTKWRGKKLYKIGTYYPSSQICNHCGYKEKKVKDLTIRKWECRKCHSENERDLNASINIMYEGVKKYMEELQVS